MGVRPGRGGPPQLSGGAETRTLAWLCGHACSRPMVSLLPVRHNCRRCAAQHSMIRKDRHHACTDRVYRQKFAAPATQPRTTGHRVHRPAARFHPPPPPAGPSQGACAPQLQALRSTTRHGSQRQTQCMHRQRLGRCWRHPHTAADRAQSAPARGGHARGGRRPGQARAPVRHNCRRCAAQHGMIRNPGWQIHAGVPGPARARHIAPRPHTPGRGKEPGSYCCPLLPSVAGGPAPARHIAWGHTPCVARTHKLSARAKQGNVVVAYPTPARDHGHTTDSAMGSAGRCMSSPY